MGMGRRGPESCPRRGHFADTLRTLRGHLSGLVRRCLRAQTWLAASSKHESRKRQPPETGNDRRQEQRISPPSTEAISVVQRTKPLATDQGRDISIAVKGAQTVPGRSPSIHTPLAPSIQPRSTSANNPRPPRPQPPEKGSSASTPNTRRGCGVEARRPLNSAWQWGAAGANPSGWWMGVLEGFRMGLPALNEAR